MTNFLVKLSKSVDSLACNAVSRNTTGRSWLLKNTQKGRFQKARKQKDDGQNRQEHEGSESGITGLHDFNVAIVAKTFKGSFRDNVADLSGLGWQDSWRYHLSKKVHIAYDQSVYGTSGDRILESFIVKKWLPGFELLKSKISIKLFVPICGINLVREIQHLLIKMLSQYDKTFIH
uniref:Uncharacterized protein n=1 Tax=Megaselia scalaris TaxID=36166 RepID=T1GZ40_MEGSC